MKSLFSKLHSSKAKVAAGCIILVALGIFAFRDQIFSPQGLQVCPDEMIVNEMPGIDRSGLTVDDAIPTRSNYYILKGDRKEIDEFDIAWVGINCSVPITTVQ